MAATYDFAVSESPSIEEGVQLFTLMKMEPVRNNNNNNNAAEETREISMARYFLSLFYNVDRVYHMKMLSYDVLYTAVWKACKIAVSLLRTPGDHYYYGTVGADMDVDAFVLAVKRKPVHDAIGGIVRLLEICTLQGVNREFSNVFTRSDVGTAVHHLMLRIGIIASHWINNSTYLSSHQLYYVANELAAELSARHVVSGAPFLVEAMRTALEDYDEPMRASPPKPTKTVRFVLDDENLEDDDDDEIKDDEIKDDEIKDDEPEDANVLITKQAKTVRFMLDDENLDDDDDEIKDDEPEDASALFNKQSKTVRFMLEDSDLDDDETIEEKDTAKEPTTTPSTAAKIPIIFPSAPASASESASESAPAPSPAPAPPRRQQQPTYKATTQTRQYHLAAADAWVREGARETTATHLVWLAQAQAEAAAPTYYMRGPAYRGPPCLDAARWDFWREKLEWFTTGVMAGDGTPAEEDGENY